jgi:hypothetical protein
MTGACVRACACRSTPQSAALQLLRRYGFRAQGQKDAPPLPVPEPPVILSVSDYGLISYRSEEVWLSIHDWGVGRIDSSAKEKRLMFDCVGDWALQRVDERSVV